MHFPAKTPLANKIRTPHPDESDPYTEEKILQDLADFHAGKMQGYTLAELRVELGLPEKIEAK